MNEEVHVQQSDAAAISVLLSEDLPKEPLLRWFAINVARLTIYLAVASFAVALVSVIGADGPESLLGLTVVYFLYGGYFGIPGTIVWLLSVSFFPPEWSMFRRRTTAMAVSPVIQVIWLVWLLSWGYGLAAAVFGLLLPAGSAFVVRFRERRPSSPWPPEDG
jgi:hypothetical protein